jgi:hypothetical protein
VAIGVIGAQVTDGYAPGATYTVDFGQKPAAKPKAKKKVKKKKKRRKRRRH